LISFSFCQLTPCSKPLISLPFPHLPSFLRWVRRLDGLPQPGEQQWRACIRYGLRHPASVDFGSGANLSCWSAKPQPATSIARVAGTQPMFPSARPRSTSRHAKRARITILRPARCMRRSGSVHDGCLLPSLVPAASFSVQPRSSRTCEPALFARPQSAAVRERRSLRSLPLRGRPDDQRSPVSVAKPAPVEGLHRDFACCLEGPSQPLWCVSCVSDQAGKPAPRPLRRGFFDGAP
jgi:hypothetical protein